MAYTDLTSLLKAIANAIRAKKGTTAKINAQNFPSEINSIQVGITPSGTKSITSNGTYDVTAYASANVNVAGYNPAIKYKNHSSTDGATSLTYTFDSYGKYRVCATAHSEVHNGNQVEFYTNGSIVSTHYSHMWSKGGGTYGGIGEDASGTGLIFWGDIVAYSGQQVKVLTEEGKSFVTLCVEKLNY